MLYHSRYTEEPEVYFLQLSCRLDGELDPAAFERAWQQVLDRHPALRTSFHWRELERPLQVVHRRVSLPFTVEDWRGLDPGKQAERLDLLLAEDRRRGFDLDRPPLLRLTLCRLAEARHQLIWSFHHLLFDGWSMPLLLQEVFAFYAAARRGETLELPRPRPYRDFILWLKRQDLAAAETFWRQALAGFTAPTPLVLGASQGEGEGMGRLHHLLGGALFAGLQDLGRRHQLTLSTLVQGAWALLLARSSGEDDVVFGLTSAGRPADLPGAAEMIGMFINTLPVRVRVVPEAPLLSWLQELQGFELRMREHEHTPLLSIQGWSEVPRGLPLFLSLAVFEGFAVEDSLAREEASLAIGEVRHVQKTNFPLAFNVSPQGDHLRLRLTYDRRRFAEPDVRRALAHVETLLAAMVETPERWLADLPWTTTAERHQIELEWNDVPSPLRSLPPTASSRARLAERMALAPDAVAVVSGEARSTYGSLARRAASVACRLRAQGVGAGMRVGLSLDRSPELVAGLLGIVAAGGTYVPIDPAYPAERRELLRRDAGLAVVVDAEWLEAPKMKWGEAILPDLSLDLPLYVIYTSGSTGEPKGAVVHERAFAALVDWYAEELGLGAGDRLLVVSSVSFDLTQKNFFAPLWTGGELHLAPSTYDPAELRSRIERQGITRLNCTPSAFYPLAEEGDPAALASLRSVVLGGEPIAVGRLDRFRRSATCRATVINSYGPTECTDVVAFRRLAPPESTEAGDPVPLGRPIPGARLWVAGSEPGAEPAPIGIPGELWIGGEPVGGGYLGDPARTAEKFLPDPSLAAPGARAYRTGDLARRLPNGEIESLGRIDHQVKIRGFRIELGEIEAVLGAHPAVREAVVVARGETLVAYVVDVVDTVDTVAGRRGAPPTDADLHRFLSARLPEPMLPGLFVHLKALPLTPSGKVDRRALPDPASPVHPASPAIPPSGELEIYLAGLFRDVLKLPAARALGAEEDFFALGGHSIAAAVLINRLQEKLGAILYAVALFDAPTVLKLAEYLIANYPEAVARVFGEATLGGAATLRRLAQLAQPPHIDRARSAAFRRTIVPLAPLDPGAAASPRNPQAIFVLSPPRSGSTLLRVMLAGHPKLFAPPELELLSFHTLAERRAAYTGRNAFWLEGTVRAVMEARRLSAEEAEAEIARLEGLGTTTRELYRQLQSWIGDRILVDKSPSYALDRAVLDRAEETFDEARYIHLLRHPYGMIHSFEEARLEQVFFRHEHTSSRRELAELLWLVSQENILSFLASVPRERQLTVRFEDLLARPVPVLQEICAFLGLDFHPDMALPYKNEGETTSPGRMTDGIHAWSKMLGDVKFLEHGKVDSTVAERWRGSLQGLMLGEETVALAERLGYPIEPLGGTPEVARVAILRRPTSDIEVPLSFSQERLWFIDQLSPGSAAYNLPAAVRLRGDLDASAFHRTLAEVVRRHDSLRTTFGFVEAGPVQRIAADLAFELPRIDLLRLPAGLRETEIHRLAQEEAHRPFDLTAGPLFRAVLIISGASGVSGAGSAEHVLLLDLHHIVADGRSIGVLIREVATIHTAFAKGDPSPLPALPVQYPDFALWQRSWLTGPVLEAQTAYWSETLRGTPVLDLPTDLPRPPVRTERGGFVRRRLPVAIAAGIAALAERGKATRFMVLAAAWGALLARTAGQLDFALGVPVAGRTRPETEGMIGFFVNTLALRLDLTGATDFPSLVARARQAALGAYAHQDLPWERVVEAVQPARDRSRSPIFQVMLAFQNATEERIALPDLTVEPIAIDGGGVKFDLALSFQEGGREELAVRAGYRTDLFFASTVARHLAHLEILLASVIEDLERPWAELPLLAAAERHQLLAEWNDTGRIAGDEAGLHEVFATVAAARPDAPAVVGVTFVLSYGELARRIQSLAGQLVRLDIGPDVRVGILLPRSAEAVTAILAVLAAGGAYVPLDPSHPAERRAFQLRDAGASLLLTRSDLLAAFPEAGVTAICLDVAAPAAPMLKSPHGAGLDRLAYVLYTSGSTGVPSGVLMPHRGALNLVADAHGRLAVGPESRVLQLAPLGFDVSVAELFVPLLSGAALCVVDDEARRDPVLLTVALARLGIDRAFVTPAFFNALPEEAVPNLRASVGGEAFSRELAERWGGGRSLFNNYGPTEAAVYATSRLVDPGALAGSGADGPSIGGPIGNVRARLLDARLQPVAVGVSGEICLGGAALARGYAGRPERTAERFVPDPFGEVPGERLYRTGDLGRLLPTGEIQFLSRIDDQLKVRGFRIEPGEIEAALLRHPAVRQAAVVVRGSAAAERHLVAYAGVPAESALLGMSGELRGELRRFLATILPEPMVPAVFVLLPALPVTANGKIDRRALPELEPEAAAHAANAATVPAAPETLPSSPLERLLLPLWQEVLGRQKIGGDEDFFALGGTSLQAAVLVRLLEEKLDEYIYVVALFEAPTIAALARYLAEHYPEAVARVTGAVLPVPDDRNAKDAGPERIGEADLDRFLPLIPRLPLRAPEVLEKIRAAGRPRPGRAFFLLSPPRSGSTLLRVLLGGHPDLFAPPELELLGFNTMGDRRTAFSGRYAFWAEGLVRALMELDSVSAEEATMTIDGWEAENLSIRDVYSQLLERLEGRLLIDKTPSYALDPDVLARAEEDFEAPLYLHLLRHPHGMIRSFVEGKLDQVFFREAHSYPRRTLAELVWLASERRILAHLAGVPAERQLRVRFEDLVRDPESEIRRICGFLGLEFHPAMLDPYAAGGRRMTDGVHALSKMLGDVKFHEHQGIDAQVADRWRDELGEDFLGEPTWRTAEALGYPRPSPPRPGRSPVVPLVPEGEAGPGRPLFLVHPSGGEVFCYLDLARELGADRPVHGLAASPVAASEALEASEEFPTVEERARVFVEALLEAQPEGPYAIGGWSLGGVLAWEVAQQLTRRGKTVELLALLDGHAPDPSTPEIDSAEVLATLAADLVGASGKPLGFTAEGLRALPEPERFGVVFAAAREAGALPAGLGEEQARAFLRAGEAEVAAVRAYRPEPYVGRVLLARATRRDGREDSLGWSSLASTGLEIVHFAATHSGLLAEPAVSDLAALLRARLAAGRT